MVNYIFKFVVLVLVVSLESICQVATNREFSSTINPFCPKNQSICNEQNLMHIVARGDRDSIHYLISSIGVPMVVMVRTAPDANLTDVDWKKLLSGDKRASITIDQTWKSVGAFGFTQLWEYYDPDDKAVLPIQSANITSYDLSRFGWRSAGVSDDVAHLQTNLQSSPNMSSSSHHQSVGQKPFFNNGFIAFNFETRTTSGRPTQFPRLEFNDNSTSLDFILNRKLSDFGKKSRFGLTVVGMADGNGSHDGFSIDRISFIDDEFTPGVFQLENLLSGGRLAENSLYMQWKPICYTTVARQRKESTKVHASGLIKSVLKASSATSLLKNSILGALLPLDHQPLHLVMFNMSFGKPQDKFYSNTNYTVWSASFGFGTAPFDQLSTLVIMVLIAGAALPVLMVVFGALFLCLRRRRGLTHESDRGPLIVAAAEDHNAASSPS